MANKESKEMGGNDFYMKSGSSRSEPLNNELYSHLEHETVAKGTTTNLDAKTVANEESFSSKISRKCCIVIIIAALILNFLLVVAFGATSFYFYGKLVMKSELTQLAQNQQVQGPPGRPGPPGPIGLKGDRGHTGAKGSTGLTGSIGLKGDRGQIGHTGANGSTGLTGERGLTGQAGLNGSIGPPGERGLTGPPGTPAPVVGGVTYIRWGSSNCSSETNDSNLVYPGRTGVSFHGHQGGAANYICMPNDPEYTLLINPGVRNHSYVYGTEYEGPDIEPLVPGRVQRNAPCAVCYVPTRNAVMMIPAKTTCPSGWTREYYGYLMSERIIYWRTMYECVDKDMEIIPGSEADVLGGHFWHVEAHCNGMACPPYDAEKELTCVVCSI